MTAAEATELARRKRRQLQREIERLEREDRMLARLQAEADVRQGH